VKTKAVRLHGTFNLRLDEFELPEIRENEILAKVISDSLCMSTYKAVKQGANHKRVPNNLEWVPVVIGHEFAGEILYVGNKWKNRFFSGQKFAIQPALNYQGSLAALGYSYPHIGGDATYVIIPNECMEMNCLLPYQGESYYEASLTEAYACVCGAFHAMYHIPDRSRYAHVMGIKEGGCMALLGGTGPMGLAAIDYIIHCDRRPAKLMVTGNSHARLERAQHLLTVEAAAKGGVELKYLNINNPGAKETLMAFTNGRGYDDVVVFAPVESVIELADSILGMDGCLNFFSGPSDVEFTSKVNFYNVHYAGTHMMGTTGSNTEDMEECLELIADGKLNPAILVSHVGGLNAALDATLHMPELTGAKKLIYTHVDMPLTAIADFPKLGESDPFFSQLAEIIAKAGGLWNAEAERYLLQKAGGNV